MTTRLALSQPFIEPDARVDGAKLKAARKAAGLSESDVTDRVPSLPLNAIETLEAGEPLIRRGVGSSGPIEPQEIRRLAVALSCGVEDLLAGEAEA